jgi:hypothetical protein
VFNRRKALDAIMTAMDEGRLDPHEVAEALLLALNPKQFEDLIRIYEWPTDD